MMKLLALLCAAFSIGFGVALLVQHFADYRTKWREQRRDER